MDHERLARDARRHHGVLLPAALAAAGVTDHQRRRRIDRGEWRRLPNGITVLSSAEPSFEMLATAALAKLSAAVLSHQTANRVHGSDLDDDSIHVTIESGRSTRSTGARVHRSDVPVVDRTVRRGFPVTTIERTLIDMGATASRAVLQSEIEGHLVRRTTTFDRVEATFLRRSVRGRPGLARVGRVLAEIDGRPPSESELEAAFVRLVRRERLPVPALQVPFGWVDGEKGRVDCWYAAAALVVELDGRRFHERTAAFERDRRRDQQALVRGIRTLRFTHRQVFSRPKEVAEVLRAVLGHELRAGSAR